jgi:hypothetical protein
MPRNDAAAPGHVCPGIRIQAIDIVQPPGIGISPIADMDPHQTIVAAALAAKSSPATGLTTNEFRVTVPYCHSRESGNLGAAGPRQLASGPPLSRG